MTDEEILAEDDRLITEDVARAIEERELVAYLQPQFDVNDERMAAIEALVRWTQPDGNVVTPPLFIPSLERTNTILGLDWYMVEEAAGFAERHRGTALDLPVSVNLSHWHFTEDNFINILTSTVDWHNVDRARFGIEVSERALANFEGGAAWVKQVRDAGFLVALDDFGSTNGSLEVLRDIEADVLKTGRGFIERNAQSERGRKIIAASVQLARDLGMRVIAQGVETADELEFMRSLGCDAIQGFYYAQPMCEADLVNFGK
ncbi:MAG: EAL domain-containing protein [Coriobacteriales bacterium]|nr:EAL domain-containing protein [Coriobacteriales bacterium]